MKLQLNYGSKTWTSSLDIGDKQQLPSYPISHYTQSFDSVKYGGPAD